VPSLQGAPGDEHTTKATQPRCPPISEPGGGGGGGGVARLGIGLAPPPLGRTVQPSVYATGEVGWEAGPNPLSWAALREGGPAARV